MKNPILLTSKLIALAILGSLTLSCSDQATDATQALNARITEQADRMNTLTERLFVLEAREEIRALILDYGWAHDHRDYRAYADLFAENGEWVSGMGTAMGPEAIFAFLDDAIGHNPLPEGSGTFHIMSNEQIDVDGDRASAVTKWVYVTRNPDDTPLFTFIGHYYDEFIRENGAWKFLRRESVREIPAG